MHSINKYRTQPMQAAGVHILTHSQFKKEYEHYSENTGETVLVGGFGKTRKTAHENAIQNLKSEVGEFYDADIAVIESERRLHWWYEPALNWMLTKPGDACRYRITANLYKSTPISALMRASEEKGIAIIVSDDHIKKIQKE